MTTVGVFIDAENISYVDLPFIMMEIKNMGRLLVTRVYADWTTSAVDNWKQYIISYALEPIHCPKIPRKNSIDIKMIDDIYDILYFRNTIDTYVLVSNDVDYLTAARKIKLYGKTLVTIGYSNCSEILRNVSDKFIDISLLHINQNENSNDQELFNDLEGDLIDLDNVFENSCDELSDDESKTRRTGDELADAIFEIMNNEKHLNVSTLKHRIKKKINVEKLEEKIKRKYHHFFRVVNYPGKKKKIYDITSINSDVYNTIDEQFLSVFQNVESNEIMLSQFREKLSLIINNFDHRMWGFTVFKEMIQSLFFGKFEIIDKGSSQYIVNLTS